MFPLDEVISQLMVSAAMDDVSFPIVLNALHDVDESLPGADDTERMLNFVSLLIDHGFVAVTSPYDDPPSAPWPPSRHRERPPSCGASGENGRRWTMRSPSSTSAGSTGRAMPLRRRRDRVARPDRIE